MPATWLSACCASATLTEARSQLRRRPELRAGNPAPGAPDAMSQAQAGAATGREGVVQVPGRPTAHPAGRCVGRRSSTCAVGGST